jgi:DNA polymerase III subunit gamma/tau
MQQDNLAYYRKYRPQALSELIGQSQIQQALEKAFQSGKLSHAYLFCGPRGTGKTSTARILAKMVNCENQLSAISHQLSDEGTKKSLTANSAASLKADDSIPCNTCSSCLTITDGSNLDLIEIDAASNRGIDDIRELRDRIKLAPTASQKKVYIIDEVHMLTTEAFNALLKTLEEPPAHALFILATTDPQKIPQTILSRVTKMDFQQASIEGLVEALKKICKSEKLDFEEEALRLIAKKGDGSFRDTEKLLDQLASGGEKITVELVEKMLRSGEFSAVIGLLNNLAKKDSKKALETIQTQLDGGVNIKDFTCSVIEHLRMILFIKGKASSVVQKELSEEKFAVVQKLADNFNEQQIVQTLELLLKSVEQMKFASIPSLPLEIAVVESSIKQPSENVILVSEERTHPESELSSRGVPYHPVQDDAAISINNASTLTIIDSQVDEVVLKAPTDDVGSTDMLKLSDKWTYILETIKPYNYSLEALLRQVKVLSIEDGILIFEVPYSFHQRILESPKSRDLLESVISDVLSKPVRVRCVLGKRPVRVEELANIELAEDDDVIKVAAEIFNSDSIN